MQPYLPKLLEYINTAFNRYESIEVRDNIVSSLFKLIMIDTQGVIPLPLALTQCMRQLPFKGDTVEQKNSIRFVIWLLNKGTIYNFCIFLDGVLAN